jgi:hypothetical protein
LKEGNKSLLIKYAICVIVASLILGIVVWSKFNQAEDFELAAPSFIFQVLSDGFSVSGILLVLFSGLMFVSGEGALLGIGFVMRNVLLWFVPMGKMHQESYQQYRERKIGRTKKSGNGCILVTGLVFLLIGVIFTIIWYTNTY